MARGKWFFRVVVALGILAGAFAYALLRDSMRPLDTLAAFNRFDASYNEKRDAIMARRYPREPALLLNRDADFYLDLFASHPDRPWHLWRWAIRHPELRDASWRDASGLPLSRQEPKTRQQAAAFAAVVRTLREKDPENGYASLLQAWLETKEGVIVSRSDDGRKSTAEVVDPGRAAMAVDLLRLAASQKRFTVYGREAGAEWLRILGKPETFVAAVAATEQMAGLPIPNLLMSRDAAQRLVAEARRRAEKEGPNPQNPDSEGTAYAILRDLQTVGGRFAVGEPTLIGVMIGYSIIELATEDGAAVLRKAGQLKAEARLLARGRDMLRLRLLARLMLMVEHEQAQADSAELANFPLADDPELIAEAKRLFALREENARRGGGIDFGMDGDLVRAGAVPGALFPNIDMHIPWTTPVFSLDELKTLAHFELWGLQKPLTAALLVMSGFLLAAMLVLYGWQVLIFRNIAEPAWPAPRQAVVGGALFGILAAGPALAAAWAGNFLWALTPIHWLWHSFWNIWGLFAACWALSLWVRVRANDGFRRPGGEFWRWLALAGLATAPLCASFIYAGALRAETPPFDTDAAALAALAAMLTPMPIWGVVCVLRWIATAPTRRLDSAPGIPGLRLFLAGWAGGMALWLASYAVIDWQERKFADRDTLFAPSLAAIGFSPIEAKLVDMHRQHVERVLATPDSPTPSSGQ